MIRRKLTLKRVDPWSVLKFGFVVNVALLLVGLLAFGIVWFTIRRLGLIEQFCGSVGTIVLDLQQCAVNGGNIFRTVLFLGVLGVVVATGIVVFGAFLYNLIADLTGGLTFSVLDESGDATLTSSKRPPAREEELPRPTSRAGARSGAPSPRPTSSAGATAAGAAGAAGSGAAGASRASHDTGSFRPGAPPAAAGPSEPSSSPDPAGRSGTPAPQSAPADRRAPDPGSAPAGPSESPAPRPEPPAEARPPAPPAGPRTDGDADGHGDRDQGRERDQDRDEDRDRPRDRRPSGSSLWGDPTRSRE